MRIVADNSDEDLTRRAAEGEFATALVCLTANLMRIVRGAGKGYDVGSEAIRLIDAMKAFQSAYGHWPEDFRFPEALAIEDTDRFYEAGQGRHDAIEQIIKGSLRLAAARLLDQKLQISAGEREIEEGLRAYDSWMQERRRAWAAEERASRPVVIGAKRQLKKKPGPKTKPSRSSS